MTVEKFDQPQYQREYPLFPLQVYIYELDGTYGEPIQVNSEAQLHGPGTRRVLEIAIKEGREVRICDPGDLLVFHAVGGKVVFP